MLIERGISSNFEEDHPPRRRYRGPKSWSFWFIPLLIIYLVFHKYRYQTSWSFPKKLTTKDRQVTDKVDMVIRQTKVEETTAMRLLGLADLELMRKGETMTNTRFIITNRQIKYPRDMDPTEKAANKSSIDIGQKRTCYYNQTGLGRVSINRTLLSLQWVDKQYPMVGRGGYYKPRGCQPRHKVAILVPCMNRPQNLASFLFNIHPFLMSQKIEYRIFVIEQHDQYAPFSKSRLYNAGFREAQKLDRWKCFIFHEVDLLPLDHSILYTCNTCPRQMSAAVEERGPTPRSLFGGVTSLSPEQFIKVNGYSNFKYLGTEDYDMFLRLRSAGFSISRYDKSIAQYTELTQKPVKVLRVQTVPLPKKSKRKNGLAELNYSIVKLDLHRLYTHILVDVNLG